MGKDASAAVVRAGAGFFAGMSPAVCLQGAALGEGLPAAGMAADKGLFPRMKPPVGFQ